MKTVKRLFSLAVALCMATGMMAQYLYDASGGTTIGRISGNRIYDASGGNTIGRIEGERILDGSGGKTLNRIMSDGRVMDSSGGNVVGYIRSNGQVMDKTNGNTLGYVENGNVYDKSHGNKIGQYRGVDAKYAAYYYFFFPGRKVSATTAKKPATTATKTQAPKITNALEPQVKETILYDRDKRKLGTLYGTERYVSTIATGYIFTFNKTNDGITVNRRDKYFCNIGKDNKTIYCNQGKDVYAIVDEQGNAFNTDGKQYGKIEDDGRVIINTTKYPNYTFGYIGSKDFDRHMMGLMYFVCYFNTLLDVYEQLDKQKEEKKE